MRSGRSYDVYLPAGLRRRTRTPVVMLLHGCRQTAAEFVHATRFTTVADRNGILLVAPHQEGRHHPQRCWRWYQTGHQQRGSGEPAALAAILARVLEERSRWRADPQRLYVAGISAGGAMALTMAATYPDLVAAAGVHSAPAHRSAVHGGQVLAAMGGHRPGPATTPIAPVVVVQGTGDHVVHSRSADRVTDQWLAARAAAGRSGDRVSRSRTDTGRTADGRRYTRVRWYTARGARVLESWSIHGLGHAWSGGRPGGSYSDPAGPRAATLMWAFFRSQRLGRDRGGRSGGS